MCIVCVTKTLDGSQVREGGSVWSKVRTNTHTHTEKNTHTQTQRQTHTHRHGLTHTLHFRPNLALLVELRADASVVSTHTHTHTPISVVWTPGGLV